MHSMRPHLPPNGLSIYYHAMPWSQLLVPTIKTLVGYVKQ